MLQDLIVGEAFHDAHLQAPTKRSSSERGGCCRRGLKILGLQGARIAVAGIRSGCATDRWSCIGFPASARKSAQRLAFHTW